MIPLFLSAALLWALLRLFGTLETEGGILRMLVLAVGVTVAVTGLREIHPLLPLPVVPALLALVLRKWCLLPWGRAVLVSVIFLGCRVAADIMLLRGS